MRFSNLTFFIYICGMKNTLLLLLILTYSIANSQSQTRFGPSIGVFKNPDIKSLAVGFQVRREYLKKKDSTNQTNKSLLYNQLEIQIVDGIDYYQMKVPVVMGFNFFNLRPNLGIEVRANLVFTGPNYLGLNRLQYDLQNKNGIYPVLGFGYDLNRFAFDFKLSNDIEFFDTKNLQTLLTVSYLVN